MKDKVKVETKDNKIYIGYIINSTSSHIRYKLIDDSIISLPLTFIKKTTEIITIKKARDKYKKYKNTVFNPHLCFEKFCELILNTKIKDLEI